MRRLRAAIATDENQLEQIKELASWSNSNDRAFLRQNPHLARALEQGEKWVLESDGRILGYAALEQLNEKQFCLSGLFVDPSFVRQGVGKTLVGCCLVRTRQQGGQELLVTPNPHAADFYEACGFEPVEGAADGALSLNSLRFTGTPSIAS